MGSFQPASEAAGASTTQPTLLIVQQIKSESES